MSRLSFLHASLTVVLLVSLVLLAGCKTPSQMKAEYPDWPNWGWWDNPAAKQADATDTADATARTDDAPSRQPASSAEPLPGNDTLSARTDADGRLDSPAEAAVEADFDNDNPLNRHRADVWKTVSMLRDLDARPHEERMQLLELARKQLPTWYDPMPVDPPDVNQPDWVKVLIWDFMPEDDFQRAVDGWRAIARKENMEFPYPATRRKVMAFVENMLDAATQSEPASDAPQDGQADGPVEIKLDEPPAATEPTPIDIPPADAPDTGTAPNDTPQPDVPPAEGETEPTND